jgi:hypothetical protein
VIGGTELAGPLRLFFSPANPVYVDECAIVSRQLFGSCTATGAVEKVSVVDGDGEIEEGVMRKRERGRMYKRRKKTHRVTPNRSMSEAHGVWVFRGYSNTKGMVSRRSSIKGVRRGGPEEIKGNGRYDI